MIRRPARARLVPLLLAVSLAACSYSENMQSLEPLVFPAEARLGATAAIVLDSNYIPLSDSLERHTLKRSQIQIWIQGDTGSPVQATVKEVFDLGAAPWSHLQAADLAKGAWSTVAVFDLPASGFSPLPQVADIIVKVNGVEDTTRKGHLTLTGTGGSPTAIQIPGVGAHPLESETVLRLRGKRANGGNPGFQDAWVIGGIEFDLEYFGCMTNPRVFPETNAAAATSLIGPIGPGSDWHQRTHVVIVDPKGFQLSQPSGGSASTAGEGPFVTMAFDRVASGLGCAEVTATSFKIENLFVTDVNGDVKIDDRGTADSNEFVTKLVVDTDAT